MVQLAVVLPARVFGGHEKMLVEWLRNAVEKDAPRRRGAPRDGAGARCLA